MQEKFKYYAFISYSHMDKKIAKMLQKRLQSYHLPSKLQKFYPGLPKNLKPVFIDEVNLIARGNLKDTLQENLEQSNYLIVICSPNSAKSVYVNDEVKFFIENGRLDYIIPFIIDGVPHAEDPSLECFPPALLELPREYELLGIDMKKFGRRDAFLRVIATMLRLDLDNFVSYEAHERRKKLMMFIPVAAAVMIIAGILLQYSIKYLDLFNDNDANTQFAIGYAYYKKKDYAKARELFEQAAAQGNAAAQFNLGYMYDEGIGVEQNYARAKEWYEQAAAQGLAYAQYNLGKMYEEGQGVEQVYAKAKELYEQAAAKGLARAQFNLGYMYRNGLGVPKDNEKAIEWFRKAADNGYTRAISQLEELSIEAAGECEDEDKD